METDMDTMKEGSAESGEEGAAIGGRELVSETMYIVRLSVYRAALRMDADALYVGHPEDPYANGFLECLRQVESFFMKCQYADTLPKDRAQFPALAVCPEAPAQRTPDPAHDSPSTDLCAASEEKEGSVSEPKEEAN